jgi:TFIIS helical bundle-like domain
MLQAIYELMMLLPAQRDHLVRSRAGVVVMGLRAHPDETPENKRLLTDIIEKWSRPVYGKGVSHSYIISIIHSNFCIFCSLYNYFSLCLLHISALSVCFLLGLREAHPHPVIVI